MGEPYLYSPIWKYGLSTVALMKLPAAWILKRRGRSWPIWPPKMKLAAKASPLVGSLVWKGQGVCIPCEGTGEMAYPEHVFSRDHIRGDFAYLVKNGV